MKKPIRMQDQIAAEIKKQIDSLPKIDAGINVAMPNTTKEKMQAICSLASAVQSLARALNSIHTDVTISNNTISNAEIGIRVQGN